MPSHYDKGDYDSREGGSSRYRGRGRGRGNYAWGSRVGNSNSNGGGRGYGRGGAGGGGSSGGSRYRGGGGHGVASSSYRETTASYHDRYSDSRRTGGGHIVNPWDAGMGPREVAGGGGYGAHATASFGSSSMGMGSSGGGGGGAGTSQLIGSLSQLSQMGNDKSKLALNILNAVLSSDSAVGEGRDVWEHGPPRKMRRMEWDELRPPPARRYPPRYSPRRTWDRRGGPSYPRGEHHGGSTDYQARRVAKARRGKPWHDTRSGKGPGREGRAKEEQDLSDDLDREITAAAAGTSAAQAPQSEDIKMEEEEGKEETEGSSSQGKTEGKVEPEEDKEGKEGEEAATAATGKSEDKSEEKKNKDTEMMKQNEAGEITWLPREALQCHMCGLSKFPDIKSYMRHLESRRHETLKYSFHAKGAAILHFLRANSKLASQRKMLKSLRRGIKGPIMRCRKCQCEVFGYIREHAKTVEHIALRNYLRVVCCNTTFFNRADLEEHRLSLIHLKNQLEEEQRRQKMEAENQVEDIGVEENEEGTLFADTVKHMKQKTQFGEVTNPENLMPYDPAIPQGLNFIWKRSHYRCKACPQIRLTCAADTEEHFKSLDHYNNLMAHLKAIEEEKEKKRLEEEEAARKAELERKKKEEAEAKAAEEAAAGEAEDKEKESGEKDTDSKQAEEGENDDSKKNGDLEGEDGEGEEEEEEATTATKTAEEEEEEEEEETSFNFEDMHNMETVDEACDDGETEGGLEGSLMEEDEAKDIGADGAEKEEPIDEISLLAEVGEELEEISKEKAGEVKKDENVKGKQEEKEKAKAEEEKAKAEEEKAKAEEVKAKAEEEKAKAEEEKAKAEEEKAKAEEEKAKAEEEKSKVKESDKTKTKEVVVKKEEEVQESPKKESIKREREEDEQPAVTVAVEGRGRGSRTPGTPRARRARGRARARSARN